MTPKQVRSLFEVGNVFIAVYLSFHLSDHRGLWGGAVGVGGGGLLGLKREKAKAVFLVLVYFERDVGRLN